MRTNFRTAVAAIAVVTAVLTASASTTPASAKRPKRAKKLRSKSGSVVCQNVGGSQTIVGRPAIPAIPATPGIPATDLVLDGSVLLVFGDPNQPSGAIITLFPNDLGPGVPPAIVDLPISSVSGLNPIVGDLFTVTILANAIPGIPATNVTLSAIVTSVAAFQGNLFVQFDVTIPAGSLVPPTPAVPAVPASPVCSSA
jgi:hypothetical protein